MTTIRELIDACNNEEEDTRDVFIDVWDGANPNFDLVEDVYQDGHGMRIFREKESGKLFSITPYDVSSWDENSMGDGWVVHELEEAGTKVINVYKKGDELLDYSW